MKISAFRFSRAAFLAALFALISCGGGSAEDQADDSRVLSQAMALCLLGDGETISVVYPDTLLVLNDHSDTAINAIADKVLGLTGVPSYDARPVLERLLKRNKRSHDLTIEAPPGANFLVDREGVFTKYLTSGNEGDWKRMFADHPEVKSIVHVGLPAYDREAGIVLVYIQEMTQSAAGNGSIYVFRDAGGTLEEQGRAVVWSP